MLQSHNPSVPGGRAHLFTFPFWLFVDGRGEPIETGTATSNGTALRFYPPFRSGQANFSPMPPVRAEAIPFLDEARLKNPLKLLHVTALPLFKADGGPGVQTMWGKNWPSKPIIFPMDSLRVDVVGAEKDTLHIDPFVRRLLEQLRLRSRQWWILRSVDALLRFQRGHFEITSDGAPTSGNPPALEHCRNPFGFEEGIDNFMWKSCVQNAVREVEVPLYEMSLLDAFHFAAAGDIRAAIISAASACEQAVEVTFPRLWPRRDDTRKFRAGFLKGNDLTSHVSQDMDKYFGRSFLNEFPQAFVQLKQLWHARNNVAHGGRAEFREQDKTVVVEEPQVEQMIKAARICIKWLLSL